ncbi:SEC-C metal-binding domain-containing protein [Myxococcota bacterium]
MSQSGLLTVMGTTGRGLACLARTCPNPGCQCRDLHIEVVPIDFRVKSVSVKKGTLHFSSAKLDGLEPAIRSDLAFTARLDPDTGELFVADDKRAHSKAESLLAPLRDAIDGQLLDDFAKLWLRLKDESRDFDQPHPEIALDEWQPGDSLVYEEVYPVPRIDGYRVGDTLYDVVDLYCPNPDCDCDEVTVAFVSATAEKDEDAGSVTVNLKTGSVTFKHETDNESLVRSLWRRFVERHRGISILAERQQRMREQGEELMRRHRQSAAKNPERVSPPRNHSPRKIGRNEPCPCGSGKKYKKCCLGKADYSQSSG